LPVAAENDVVRLTSLVTIEAEDGTRKTLFIGPVAGGVKISDQQTEIMVITPASPLGRELLNKSAGDSVEIMTGTTCTEYELVAVR